MNTLTTLFIIFLGARLLTQLWLANRHIGHITSHRAKVPDSFSSAISLTDHRKAADYTIAKTQLGIIEDVVATLLLLIWTLGGGLELLDQLWRSLGQSELITGTSFILSAILIMGLLELPLQIYHTFVLEARFGFNKTTMSLFITDTLKQTAIMLLIGVPLVAAVLWLMGLSGPLWWLWVWLLWVSFTLLLLWAYPVVIAPLFNKFEPLTDSELKERIQNLLDRTGFRSRGVFVLDGSKRSGHGNAYFTGFGKNKRIVFFDTLVSTLEHKEIEAVLAHELGHFKLHHVVKRMVLMFVTSLAGLALLGWLIETPWFYPGLGLSAPSTYGALMLFLLVVPVFTFFLGPVIAWSSRKHEFEADAFASQQVNANSLVSALVKMYEENATTLTPDPVHSQFYDSHPPASVRISQLLAQT
ncbi:MAG TPA: M48 family peptidase [Acidiferrobacteraceae bacterium]|nr:M48 family peptidase [Acidiferrobacteraceae bacterium]